MARTGHIRPEARCPIRPGEPCTLCQVSVTGPQDCGLVYLVMNDDDLRAGLRNAGSGAVGGRPERPAARVPTPAGSE
jgi:hypothetical protein